MKPRILLLEDDLVLRDFLASSLMSAKYEVIRVAQPEQALTLMDMTPFELAIFDGGLPGMNGIEVMQEARSRGFEGKFILISANPSKFLPSKKEHALSTELGIVKVFKKPFPFSELVSFIEALGQDEFKELTNLATDDSLTLMTEIRHDASDDRTVVSLPGSTLAGGSESEVVLGASGPSGVLEGSDFLAQMIDDAIASVSAPKPETKPGERPLSLRTYDTGPDDDLSTNAFLASAQLLEQGLDGDLTELLEVSAVVPAAPLSSDELSEVLPTSELAPSDDARETEDKASLEPEALATPAADDVLARINAVKEAYGEKLEGQLCELVRAIGLARRQRAPEALEDVIERSHKLHGSSGTFGFAEVSEVAGWLEALFGDVRDGQTSLSDQQWEEIYDNVERAFLSQKASSPVTTAHS